MLHGESAWNNRVVLPSLNPFQDRPQIALLHKLEQSTSLHKSASRKPSLADGYIQISYAYRPAEGGTFLGPHLGRPNRPSAAASSPEGSYKWLLPFNLALGAVVANFVLFEDLPLARWTSKTAVIHTDGSEIDTVSVYRCTVER
jgi:hypothetical protein